MARLMAVNPPKILYSQGDYPQIARLIGDVPEPGVAESYRQDGAYSLGWETQVAVPGRLNAEWDRPQATKERVQYPGVGGPYQWEHMGVGGNISEANVPQGEEAAVLAATGPAVLQYESPGLGGRFRDARYVVDEDGVFWAKWDLDISNWLYSIRLEQYFRDGAMEKYDLGAGKTGERELDRVAGHYTPQIGDSAYIWVDDTASGKVICEKMLTLEPWETITDPPWHNWFTRKDYFGVPNWAWVVGGGAAAAISVAAVTRGHRKVYVPRQQQQPSVVVVKG